MANRDLTPWGPSETEPFGRDMFNSVRREIDRVFNSLAPRLAEPRSFLQGGTQGQTMWPSVDVKETDKAYVVTADLPGLDKKNIDVDLRENVLTISGEKREERTEEGQGRRYAERFFGQFQRSIPFDIEVEPDKVDAELKNGVLTITVPKSPQAKGRTKQIEVRAG
jgi:HSP20 family protein